jgi:hypothetical protein
MLISVSTTEIQVTKDLMEQRAILVLAVLIAAILVLGYFLSRRARQAVPEDQQLDRGARPTAMRRSPFRFPIISRRR